MLRIYALSIIIAGISTLSLFADNILPGDSSFETSAGVFAGARIFDAAPDSALTLTQGETPHGKRFLKWNSSRISWICGSPVKVKPGEIYTYSFYARAERSSLADLMIVNTKWKQTIIIPVKVGPQWQRFSYTFKAVGDCYWPAFRNRETNMVTYNLDAFQLEPGSKLSPYVNQAKALRLGIQIISAHKRVFFKDEPIQCRILLGEKKLPANKFNLKLFDYYNNIVFSREIKINENDYEKKYYQVELPQLKKLGLYVLRINSGNKSHALKTAGSFVVVQKPLEIKSGKKAFCGMNGIHNSGMKRLGVQWIEIAESWRHLEGKKGEIKVDNLKFMLKAAKAAGFRVKLCTMPIPCAPEWSFDPEDVAKGAGGIGLLPAKKNLPLWEKFIRTMVNNSKEWVDLYEFGGEDDLICSQYIYYKKKYPDSVRQGYTLGPVTSGIAEMIKIACETTKSIAPDTPIGIIRPSGVDCNNVSPRFVYSSDVLKKCGNKFDYFAVDPYGSNHFIGPESGYYPRPEEYFFACYDAALEATKKYNQGQRIYTSEVGYTIDARLSLNHKLARRRAAYLSRSFLISRSYSQIGLLFWYVNNGVKRGNYEYGIWRGDNPLPSTAAYSTVAGVVENALKTKLIKINGGITAVIIKKADRSIAAIWNEYNEKCSLVLPPSFKTDVKNIIGNTIKPDDANSLTVGEEPVYLIKHGKNQFEDLITGIRQIKISASNRLKVDSAVIADNSLMLNLFSRNKLNNPVKIVCKRDHEVVWSNDINILQNKKLQKRINFAKKIKNKGEIYILAFDKSGEKIFNGKLRPSFISCAKRPENIKIDGKLNEWYGLKAIRMNKRNSIQPADPWISWDGVKDFSALVCIANDQNYLYFAAKVTDDKHFNKFKEYDIWKGDSIQIGISSQAFPNETKYTGNDIEIGFALKDSEPYFYCWTGGKYLKNIVYAIKRSGNKTCYEVKIPFKALGIDLKKQNAFKLNFLLHDDDTGAGSNYYYQYSPGMTNGKHPSRFKTFKAYSTTSQ
jgi:hypothetical protein